jgi:hypothetical protein
MNSNWNEGYTSEVEYSHGYYAELNPLRAALALLHAGFRPPTVKRACELGFGQGVSLNVHAAAGDVQWYGTDFNSSHVAFGRLLTKESGAGSRLYDDSFEAFAAREDLPEFDFIGLHGVWSWISDSNRELIIQIVSKHLAVGGVLYLSYNTLPGWAGFAPIRHLMTLHTQSLGGPAAGILTNIDGAISFTDRLLATTPAYLKAHPTATARLEQLKKQDKKYLAHEYFNKDWRPMYFSEIADRMAGMKLTYAGSAAYLERVNSLNLTEDQQAVLAGIPSGNLRETARDLMVNQPFRRDYWVKGSVKLAPLERAELLREQRVILCKPRGDVPKTVTGVLGTATLTDTVYEPILERLQSHKVWSLGELEHSLSEDAVDLDAITEAALVLTNLGAVAPAQPDALADAAQPSCDRLNTFLFNHSRSADTISVLACPVTGGGFMLDRISRLLFAFARQRPDDKEFWATATAEILEAQGQRLLVDGQPIITAEENLDELRRRAKALEKDILPILKALRIG